MPPEPQQYNPVTPQGSTTPLISSAQRADGDSTTQADGAEGERDPKTGKRRFFGLGKKKDDKKDMAAPASNTPSTLAAQPGAMRPPSPGKAASELKPQPAPSQPVPISPARHPYPSAAAVAASPGRLRSSSPRLHSPASSEIFERNVQEPVQIATLQEEHSEAHIPTHVITEDHIPPALEASAQAITSEELNPDEVEIVMSASHQPAGSILEGSSSHADLSQLNSPMSPLAHVTSQDSEPASSMHQSGIVPDEDGASNYGQLDPNDVRRLSFISFADVVQSEHQQPPGSALSEAGNRDSLHIASLPSSFMNEARAASPLRTPRSPTSMQSRTLSGGVTTPPPGVNVDSTGLEQSPGQVGMVGAPVSPTSELTIETMRQAVRRTASGDLSARGGMSPVSDEALSSAPRSRTNS
jgi:hypothetical protein